MANTPKPIVRLSRKIQVFADKVGGCAMVLPWPRSLLPGPPLELDQQRPMTPAEWQEAMRLIGAATQEIEVEPNRDLSAVAKLKRPANVPRADAVEYHLVVRLLGFRVADPMDEKVPAVTHWWPGEWR